MPHQNKFTIIPPVARHDGDSAPARPMTSKQVRKAYKAATKTPSMSRADRIKWEREEQERIKKEFEKERTAAKARAAREKKKDKEMAQREEKRRNGLPLVSVRPSQDTIARFVRGNGSARKRDTSGAVVKTADGEDNCGQQDGEPPDDQGTTALGSIEEADEDGDGPGAWTEIPDNAASDESPKTKITHHNLLQHKNATDDTTPTIHKDVTEDTDTHLVKEAFDVDLELEDLINEAEFEAAEPLEKPPEVDEHTRSQTKSRGAIGFGNMAVELMPSQDLLSDDEDLNLEMLQELDELLSGSKTPKAKSAESPIVHVGMMKTVVQKQASAQYQWNHVPRHTVAHHYPEDQPRPKTASSYRRVQTQSSSPDRPRQAPPMGTQAILGNLDDFFPTSSQQQRELEEEQDPASQRPEQLPYKTHGLREEATLGGADTQTTSSAPHKRAERGKADIEQLDSDFGSFPSTAHFSLVECSITMQQPRQKIQTHIDTQAAAAAAAVQPLSKPGPPPRWQTPGTDTSDTALPPPPSPPAHSPQPSRFFTFSGSREQLSLALQRSRRSAALEEIQRRERQRQEAGLAMRQSSKLYAEEAAAAAAAQQEGILSTALGKKMNTKERNSDNDGMVECGGGGGETGLADGKAVMSPPPPPPSRKNMADKENARPLVGDGLRSDDAFSCSQETEYGGGDWMEDAAWDLAMC